MPVLYYSSKLFCHNRWIDFLCFNTMLIIDKLYLFSIFLLVFCRNAMNSQSMTFFGIICINKYTRSLECNFVNIIEINVSYLLFV